MAKILVFLKKESVSTAMNWCDGDLDSNSEYYITNGKGAMTLSNRSFLITGHVYGGTADNLFRKSSKVDKGNIYSVETLRVEQNEEL